METRFSRLALSDLRGISDYTREIWGEEQKDVYLNKIYSFIEDISTAPNSWRMRNHLYPGCQSALCQKHVIYFIQRQDILLIARVLHQQMDAKRHLTKDSFKESDNNI